MQKTRQQQAPPQKLGVKKDELPQDVVQHCTEFTNALTSIESLLKPLLKYHQQDVKDISPTDRAKLNLCCAYTVNTLFYMYLKTQGVDPNEHPVKEELKRVQLYFAKLREKISSTPEQQQQQQQQQEQQQQQLQKPKVTVDKEAANRILSNTLGSKQQQQQQQNEKAKKKKRAAVNDDKGESPKKRRRKNK